MSVENSKIIDLISINEENIVVLTISDHLEWDSDNEHLLLLQDKINTYLSVLDDGEIYESYPDALGKKFQIDVACKYSPNQEAISFFLSVTEVLLKSGYAFSYYHLDNA